MALRLLVAEVDAERAQRVGGAGRGGGGASAGTRRSGTYRMCPRRRAWAGSGRWWHRRGSRRRPHRRRGPPGGLRRARRPARAPAGTRACPALRRNPRCRPSAARRRRVVVPAAAAARKRARAVTDLEPGMSTTVTGPHPAGCGAVGAGCSALWTCRRPPPCCRGGGRLRRSPPRGETPLVTAGRGRRRPVGAAGLAATAPTGLRTRFLSGSGGGRSPSARGRGRPRRSRGLRRSGR